MTEGARSGAFRDALVGFGLAGSALVTAVSLLLAQPGVAIAAPQASNATVESPDPASITFKVRATADADIASAIVNYKVLSPDGNVGGSLRSEVGGGKSVDASATLQTNTNERYIPTGTQITYAWTITDKNGASATSPEATVTFLDGRYQ